MSRAEHLLEKIENRRVDIIDELIDERESESQWLDFKNVGGDWRPTSIGQSNSKNFSKALSGFGNGEGGVIIWGVDCRPDKDRGDLPLEKRPIQNPAAFRALLEDAVSKVATPHHTGGVRSLVLDSGPDEGYVCTYVPRGPDQPYRALTDNRYYYRIGSSFEVISHDILSGMFGRVPKPALDFQVSQLKLDVRTQGYGYYWFRAVFSIDVINYGPGFAKTPHILSRMVVPSKCFGTRVKEPFSWDTGRANERSLSHVWTNTVAVPPYRVLPFMTCDLVAYHDQPEAVGFELWLGAEGTPIDRKWFGFTAKDLMNAAMQKQTLIEGTSTYTRDPVEKLLMTSFGPPVEMERANLNGHPFSAGGFLEGSLLP